MASFLYSAPKDPKRRLLMALINSSALATLLTILGHTVLGFEQSLAQLATCIVTGYVACLFFETIDGWSEKRAPRYMGGGKKGFFLFLLSNHMTSITISFLVYPGSSRAVLAFAVVAAIASKYLFRITIDGRKRHFLNPSNSGIIAAIFCFPFVSTIPYVFTEFLHGHWKWMVPAIILVLGTRLNALFTGRFTLIFAWLAAFALQGIIRAMVIGTDIGAELFVMTGPAFVLFTFYMITDPMTSPSGKSGQIVFGISLATVYSLLMAMHIANQIFLAVLIVTASRGLIMYLAERRKTAKKVAQGRHQLKKNPVTLLQPA
jgi:enediyne biosynthesis protein E5